MRPEYMYTETTAKASRAATGHPCMYTKYAPAAAPAASSARPALRTFSGSSRPSGSTPVPPLMPVLRVLESMPRL